MTNERVSIDGFSIDVDKERGDTSVILQSPTAERLPSTVIDRLLAIGEVDSLTIRAPRLVDVPDRLWTLKGINELHLRLARVDHLAGIGQIDQLAYLTIRGPVCTLDELGPPTTLPAAIIQLPRLKSVDLMYLFLEGIPEPLCLSTLKTISLQHCRIHSFGIEEKRLNSLDRLHCHSCDLSRVELEFDVFPSLTSLSLNNCRLPPCKEFARLPDGIRSIKLQDCELEQVPQMLLDSKKQIFVTLNNNNLLRFPEEVNRAPNMLSLDLGYCGIREIPVDWTPYPNLTELNLTGNDFSTEGYKRILALQNKFPDLDLGMPNPPPKGFEWIKSDEQLCTEAIEHFRRLGATIQPVEKQHGKRGSFWNFEFPYNRPMATLLTVSGSAVFARVTLNRIEQVIQLSVSYDEDEEYRCFRISPYLHIGFTVEFEGRLLVRLDDDEPEDPMVYLLDSLDYDKDYPMPTELTLSELLEKCEPCDGV